MKTYFIENSEDPGLKLLFHIVKYQNEYYCSDPDTFREVKIHVDVERGIHIPTYDGQALQVLNEDLGEPLDVALLMIYRMGMIAGVDSAYRVTREYGGPEEGGWYYDNWEYLGPAYQNPLDDDNGTPIYSVNSNGHVRHVEELFAGDNETKSTPYYS